MSWVLLYLAILVEVCGTLMLKYSNGFTKPLFAAASLGFYSVSFYLLALVFRHIDVGIAYAIWAAVGITLVVIAGWFLWNETLSLIKVFWIALIIIGVVGLQIHTHQTT